MIKTEEDLLEFFGLRVGDIIRVEKWNYFGDATLKVCGRTWISPITKSPMSKYYLRNTAYYTQKYSLIWLINKNIHIIDHVDIVDDNKDE